MSDLCGVCRGAGNVGVYPNLYRCWPCDGAGVRVQYQHPFFNNRSKWKPKP